MHKNIHSTTDFMLRSPYENVQIYTMERIEDIVARQGGIVSLKGKSTTNEYRRILRAVKAGKLLRIREGVYALPYILMDNMMDIETIIPKGVVCLYNAWAHYGLTMQTPPTFCVAIEAKRKIVLAENSMVTIYYWNEQSLTLGVEEAEISSHKVRITNPERSVCDAVRFRNKIGEDLCLEIIRNYLKRPERKIGLLMEYAKAFHVGKILNNYLNILME